MNALAVSTPRYVLRHQNTGIGPSLSSTHSGPRYTAIYAFSDKQPYDVFCKNSQQALVPYPLVARYLSNQLAEAGDTIPLLVIDAAGPNEPYLHAATYTAVLEAIEKREALVSTSFSLEFDPSEQAYRVAKAAIDHPESGSEFGGSREGVAGPALSDASGTVGGRS